METKIETKIVMPDYKTIRELSHRIDCTITEADFFTNYPNPHRIDCLAGDIRRYLSYVGGSYLWR